MGWMAATGEGGMISEQRSVEKKWKVQAFQGAETQDLYRIDAGISGTSFFDFLAICEY